MSKTVGPPKSRATLTGAGFGVSETIDITFDSHLLAMATTNGNGAFSKKIKVPSSALPGAHTVTATGESSGESASAAFTVRTDWPKFHFDLANSGFNPYENILSPTTVSGLGVKWSVTAPSAIIEGPAVAGGIVYQGDGAGAFFAIDSTSGSVLWRDRLGVHGGMSSPAVASAVVYVGAFGGKVYALDASTGATVWSFLADGLVSGSPAVTKGMVYIGSSGGYLYALDAAIGAVRWSASVSAPSTAAVSGGVVYVGGYDAKVYAFDAQTGATLWSTAVEDEVISGPAVAGNLLYVGTSNL